MDIAVNGCEMLESVQPEAAVGGMSCCLEENSRIMLYSGEERKIKDLRIGDHIMGRKGNPVIILNIWRGFEREPLIMVFAEKGHTLCVTGFHPILVLRNEEQVKIRVAQLQVGDKVWTQDEEWIEVIDLDKTEADKMVCNLSLEDKTGAGDGQWMYAERILVGDFEMQNSI